MGSSQYPEWSGAPTLNFWQGDPVKNVPLWSYIRSWPSGNRKFLVFTMETDPDGQSTTPSAPLPTGVTLTGTNTEYVTYPGSGGTNGTTTGIQFRVTDTRNGVHRSSPLTQVKIAGQVVQTPSQPFGVTATPKSLSTIEVAWTPGAGGSAISTYRIYRDDDGVGAFTYLASSATSPYTDSTLTAGTKRWYSVAAEDGTGAISQQSVSASATTFPGPPAIPVNVSAYGVDTTKIRVNWVGGTPSSAQAPTAEFRVYRAPPPGTTFAQVGVDQPLGTTSYDDGGHSADETFFYQVRAVDASNVESDPSAIVSAATYAPLAPETPINPSARPLSDTEIEVTWSPGLGGGAAAANYRVYRTFEAGGAWTLKATQAGTTYNDTAGLTAGTTKWYTITALSADGIESGQSVIVSATTLAAPGPSVPTITSVVAQSQTILRVTWTPGTVGPAPTTYKVYRSDATDGTYNSVGTVTAPTVTFDDTGLTAATTWFYKVTALDGTTESERSAAVSGTTDAVQTPTTPTSVTVTALTSTSLRVAWARGGAGSYATKFHIRRATASGGPFNVITGAAGDTDSPYDDSVGLTADTDYWYTVQAEDANGALSGQSVSGKGHTLTSGTTLPPATKFLWSDYAQATINSTIAGLVPGDILELANRTGAGLQTWARTLAFGVSGTSTKPITVRVKDGHQVRLSAAGQLLRVTGSYLRIAGNTTGRSGLELGNTSLWSVSTGRGWPQSESLYVTSSAHHVVLENMTVHGADQFTGNVLDGSTSKIVCRNVLFDLHGTNARVATQDDMGDLVNLSGQYLLLEDCEFKHGGHANNSTTGPLHVYRRCVFDGYWGDKSSYPGNRASNMIPGNYSNRIGGGPAVWGPIFAEDSIFKNTDAAIDSPGDPCCKMQGYRIVIRGSYFFDNAAQPMLGPGFGDIGGATGEVMSRNYVYHCTTYNSYGVWRNNDLAGSQFNDDLQNYRFVNNIFADVKNGDDGNGNKTLNVVNWDVNANAVPAGFANAWRGTIWRDNLFQFNASATLKNFRLIAPTGAVTEHVTVNGGTGTGSGTSNAGWANNIFSNDVTATINFQSVGTVRNRTKAGFALTSGDGVGDATALTLANGAAGVASKTLIVDDAGFFYPGWDFGEGKEPGDWIKVGATTVQITDVNYTTNTLTLATAITWSDNAQIFWAGSAQLGNAQTLYDNRGAAQ